MAPPIIDTPIERLPHIDEHVIGIGATMEEVWDALLETLPKVDGERVAGILGVEHRIESGDFGAIGSTIPGFVVSRSVPPAVLALLGQHRFSRYALIFRLEKTDSGTALRAETRAEFPGTKGRIYRTLVIGTRVHVLVTRRILNAVRKRAEGTH